VTIPPRPTKITIERRNQGETMPPTMPESGPDADSLQPAEPDRICFAGFTLDAHRECLVRGNETLRLRPQTYHVLEYLLRHANRVVTKEELFDKVWAGVVVTDDSLVQCVKEIRHALGDDGQRLIRTVPRRGYMLSADVTASEAQAVVTPQASAVSTDPKPRHQRRRRLALALGALVLGVCLAAFLVAHRTPTPAAIAGARLTSIAILPFAAIGPADGADEYLTLGLADAVITRLSSVERLATRPTGSILRYRDGVSDPQAVGRELGVDYVLDSRLQRAAGRLRVTFQLVGVADGSTRLTDRMEVTDAGIFELQDSIAERVAGAIVERLSREDRRMLRQRDTQDAGSHLEYLRGRHFWLKRTEAGLNTSIEHFRRAIALDARNAAAHAGLADAYNLLAAYGSADPRNSFTQARAAAVEALEIDPRLAEAHASLAFARAHADRDWELAEQGYQRAISLAPEYATARQWRALALSARGRTSEAIEETRRALRSDPLSLIINTDLGRHYYYARRYDEAIVQLRSTIDLDPAFPRAHAELGRAYSQKGLHDLAVAELTRAVQLSERASSALSELAAAYARQGDRARALALVSELEQRVRTVHVSPYHFAVAWSALGDKRRALAEMDAADAERFNWVVFAAVEPDFDPLRKEPAFVNLVERLGVAH